MLGGGGGGRSWTYVVRPAHEARRGEGLGVEKTLGLLQGQVVGIEQEHVVERGKRQGQSLQLVSRHRQPLGHGVHNLRQDHARRVHGRQHDLADLLLVVVLGLHEDLHGQLRPRPPQHLERHQEDGQQSAGRGDDDALRARRVRELLRQLRDPGHEARMGVPHGVDVALRHLQQIRAEVETFLEAGEVVQGRFDGVGWEGAVGLRFDQGAGGGVPEVNEAGLEGRGGDAVGRCPVVGCCKGVG